MASQYRDSWETTGGPAPIVPCTVTLVMVGGELRSIHHCEADGIPHRLSPLASGSNKHTCTLLTGKGVGRKIL